MNLQSKPRLKKSGRGAGALHYALLAIGLVGALHAQTLTSLGSTAPIPGANDISQLSTSGNTTSPDALNYYTDNNPPPAQTFTTGSSAMRLKSLAIKTAGLNAGNGYGTPASTPTYHLRLYSISGSTATLLITFSAPNPGYTDGDWLKWSGLNVPLAANKTYAFSFGIKPSTGGWAALAVATGAYSGGEIALIPTSGGSITTGSSHTFDAVFDLGLQPAPADIPANMPWPVPTYGWNLGNTLEATWGVPNWNPTPFYTAANAGFNAVRIPCAWDFNSDPTTHQINPAFMAQVKQAVDYAIAAGMYVVINDHWDKGWLENNIGTTVDPTINAKMKSYWTQIATAFAGYDNHLLFAGANEPNVDSPAKMNTLLAYYQTFINAVRSVGGNNTNRWLVLQSVSAPSWLTALPADSTPNRLMVEYHYYSPAQFAILSEDATWGIAKYFWGPAYHYAGDPTRNCVAPEEGAIDSGFQELKEQYIDKGIPVMIGEFGVAGKPTTGEAAAYSSASSVYWNKCVVDSAIAHGLSPFHWSTPGSIIDWTTGAITNAQAVTVLTGGAAPPPPNGAPYAPSALTATATNNQIALSWTAGSGATSYNLYRAAESGYESTTPVVTGITGTTYTDTNLNSGTTYYYQVVAVNGSGLSGFSPEVHATTAGVNPDPTQYHFETDTQRWNVSGSQISGVATSTAQHFAGNQSLAVNFNGSSGGTSSVYLSDLPIVAGTTVTFHVWIPSGSPITAIEPFLSDYNWAWNSVWSGNFTANAWNTLTFTIPSSVTTPLKQFGLRITTSGTWTGTCYVDSVGWATPAPAVPTGLAAVAGAGQITLNWSASPTAANYYVRRSTTSGSGYVTIANTGNLTFTDTGLVDGTTYYYVVAASNLNGASANSAEVSATPLAQAPYGGTPWPVPGVIQAENYDVGGQGFAYNDSDTINSGGQYRSEGVDVETCAEGGYNVGWIGAGEWLEYTVNVAYTGSYGITLRAASASSQIQGHVEFDGVDATGLMTAPATGGWQTYTDVTATNVNLTAGQHVMRVFFNGGAWNLNHVTITANPLPAPQNVTATPGNAKITLSWDAVSGADDYTIQRSASSGGTYTNLATGISATTYVNSGLADGTTWYYTVAANGPSGLGTASAPVSATTYTTVENWRLTHFGTIANSGNAADSADPDGDGMTNTQEFTAGTNPTSAASALKVSQMQPSGNDMIVHFLTVAGKTYRVEHSDTLQNGSWTTVQDNIAGTGSTVQVTDTGGAASGKRFYRVVVW